MLYTPCAINAHVMCTYYSKFNTGTIKKTTNERISPSMKTAFRTANTAPTTMLFWDAASKWRSQDDLMPTVALSERSKPHVIPIQQTKRRVIQNFSAWWTIKHGNAAPGVWCINKARALPVLVSCGHGFLWGVLKRCSKILQVSLAPGSESCSLQAAIILYCTVVSLCWGNLSNAWLYYSIYTHCPLY